MRSVHIGCSGWNYKDWRERFYPKGLPASRWLEHYATVFDTVEVNATFYRLPKRETVQHWAEQTPKGFEFAIKASRYLTHIKRLRELPERLDRLMEPLEPLIESKKMGPLLWQLPENFHRDDERLAEALPALPKGVRNGIEFRHPSWFAPDVMAMLREHKVALVIGDHPERPFQTRELTAGWTYVRLHLGAKDNTGNYTDAELDTWKRRMAAWRSRAEVYLYANDDWRGFAVQNAVWLKEHLRA
jgi:uncharacterized protein YecE (DUF72 family)